MAFNFFGTFTRAQWESFKVFTKIQKLELHSRKKWIEKELLRVGVFITEYGDDNYPKSFSVTPATSYGAKLLSAYRILGGYPEREMLLRTRDIPVFLTKGEQISVREDGLVSGGYSDTYTNSRRWRGSQRYDRDLGLRIERLKIWQLDAIKAKREKLEFKIKRALDYSDQLQQEVVLIDRLLTETSSVNTMINRVEIQMATPYTANVVNDQQDLFGLNIGNVSDRTLAAADELAKAGAERGGPGSDQGAE